MRGLEDHRRPRERPVAAVGLRKIPQRHRVYGEEEQDLQKSFGNLQHIAIFGVGDFAAVVAEKPGEDVIDESVEEVRQRPGQVTGVLFGIHCPQRKDVQAGDKNYYNVDHAKKRHYVFVHVNESAKQNG